MKIGVVLNTLLCLLFLAPFCFSQDPLPILKSGWEFSIKKGQQVAAPQTGPAKQMTVDDTVVARTSREFRTDHPENPSDQTPDGRRAVIEKIEQQAKTPQPTDVTGFLYSATVRNDSSKTVKVVYWEYRFAELANRTNVGRRQFLCSVNLKKGGEMELRAFSTLGPTDSITVKSLAKKDEKHFDEKVLINRIEYSDDNILQRGNWKLADHKTAIDAATATPWGKEICRVF
jgi:hypothetical protein